MNAVLESQTQQLIDQYPLGPVTRCLANPYPLYGISETGKTMTHHVKDQDTLPDPAPQGFPARLALPPRAGVALISTPTPHALGGFVITSQDPTTTTLPGPCV